MYILFYTTLILLIAYGILIEYYRKAWNSLKSFEKPNFEKTKAYVKVTVIIPARNEEKNIAACLESVLQQSYPRELLEIIVVNDHSTDQTEAIVQKTSGDAVRLIHLRDYVREEALKAPKKKAIEFAIGMSTGDLIVTTDADCLVPRNWIQAMAVFYQQQQAAFIAAPVKIPDHASLLSVFQSLDFITLQGITAASVHKKIHSMSNGANLGYEKKAFHAVEGFKGIDQTASGDDMLLMYKISKKYPDHVFFLKSREAIVRTTPAAGWKEFFGQRIRWASKADQYDDRRILWVLLLVYVLNFSILVFLVGSVWNLHWLLFFAVLVIGKTLLEFSFVETVARFFDQGHLMKYFIFLQPLHIFYMVVAGSMGRFVTFRWKGRQLK